MDTLNIVIQWIKDNWMKLLVPAIVVIGLILWMRKKARNRRRTARARAAKKRKTKKR